jgi:hypothetical protein
MGNNIKKLQRAIAVKSSGAETLAKYKYAEELIQKNICEIKEGKTIYALVGGAFIFGDVIEALLTELNKGKKEERITAKLHITTLSLSVENVHSFRNLVEWGYCTELNLLISNGFYSTNRVFVYDMIELFEKYNAKVAIADVHTKIIIIELSNGITYHIFGSANLRSSDCLENFLMSTNREMIGFDMEWMKNIFDEYTATLKPIRSKRLRDAAGVEETFKL